MAKFLELKVSQDENELWVAESKYRGETIATGKSTERLPAEHEALLAHLDKKLKKWA
jgi:hypothetical protein